MQGTGLLGAAVGTLMVLATVGPPPVILDLGPVSPTPVPTPKAAARKRLITTITVQNSAAGESVVSFEATDVADEGEGKVRMLAAKSYSLADEGPELRSLRERIMGQVRQLERAMLDYVERAGPPEERAPLVPSEQRPGSGRPR